VLGMLVKEFTKNIS